MLAILHLLGILVANLIKSRQRLEIENLFLRHQLNIALRLGPHRPRLGNSDRALMVWLICLWPSLIGLAPAWWSPIPSCDGIEQGFGPIGHAKAPGRFACNRRCRDYLHVRQSKQAKPGPRAHDLPDG